MPDITGSIQSSSTRSGCASAMRISASCPSRGLLDPEALLFQIVAQHRRQRRLVLHHQHQRLCRGSCRRCRPCSLSFVRLPGASHRATRRRPTCRPSAASSGSDFAGHRVVDGLGDIGRMVADPLQVLGDEQQMRAGRDVARVFHHVGDQLAEDRVVEVVDHAGRTARPPSPCRHRSRRSRRSSSSDSPAPSAPSAPRPVRLKGEDELRQHHAALGRHWPHNRRSAPDRR